MFSYWWLFHSLLRGDRALLSYGPLSRPLRFLTLSFLLLLLLGFSFRLRNHELADLLLNLEFGILSALK